MVKIFIVIIMDEQTLAYLEQAVETLENIVEIMNEINSLLTNAIDKVEQNMEDYSS